MLILFFPKENLYYFAHKQLISEGVLVSADTLREKPTSLELSNTKIYFEKIELANISTSDILLLGFYNHLEFDDIVLSTLSNGFLPPHITHAELSYSLLHPLEVFIKADGDFGKIEGSYNLQTREISIRLYASKRMLREYKNGLKIFKKLQKGEYLYEKAL